MLNKKLSLLVLPLVATLSLHANDPFFDDPFGDDIFKEMMHMQQNMDKMFDRMQNRMQQRATRQITPMKSYKIIQQSEFVDKGNSYEFITNIPENKENQIDIVSKDGVLSITAKIIEKHETKTQSGFSSSSSMRMYQRSINLPNDVDENSIEAKYKDGKLVISIEKKNHVQKPVTHIKIHKKETQKIEKPDANTTETNSTKENNNTQKNMKSNSDMSSMS